MLESVFISILIMGFVLFIIGIEKKSLIYSALSLLFWIIVLATHMYIVVPNDTYYAEYALFPLSFAFIIVNIIALIYEYMTRPWSPGDGV